MAAQKTWEIEGACKYGVTNVVCFNFIYTCEEIFFISILKKLKKMTDKFSLRKQTISVNVQLNTSLFVILINKMIDPLVWQMNRAKF